MSGGARGSSLVPGFHSLEVVHRGAASTVYRALSDGGDDPVVLKVMRDEGGAAEVERLRALSGLPGVVPVVGDGRTTSGRPFVAMACVDGGDYGAVARRGGPLPVDEVTAVGLAVARALEAVHALGLLHHGVEPGNLLASGEATVLIDAGAVLPADTVPPAAGLDVDVARYAPPEALRGEPHSAASDVYRLAATLWTLLAGHPPFDDGSAAASDPFAHRERVLGDDPPRLPREDVPAALEAVLVRALAKDPAGRFADAAGFAGALREAAEDVPVPPLAEPVVGEPSPPEETAVPEAQPAGDAETAAPAAAADPPVAAVEPSPVGRREPEAGEERREHRDPATPEGDPDGAASPPCAQDGTAGGPVRDGAEDTAWWEDEGAPPGGGTVDGVPDPLPRADRSADGSADSAPGTPGNGRDGVDRTPRGGRDDPPPSDAVPEPEPSDDPWAGLDVWSGPPPTSQVLPAVSSAELRASAPPPPEGWTPSPSARVPATPMPGRRWPRYAAVAGAGLVLAAVVAGAAALLLRTGAAPSDQPEAEPSADASAAPPASVVEEAAPTGVSLDDSGDTALLTWEDNTDGQAAHHVVGGVIGSVPAALASVAPGRAAATVDGLDADREYCFTVIAVVSVDEVAYSDEVCTARG